MSSAITNGQYDRLLENYIKMIHGLVGRICSHPNNYDDLFQVGTETLYRCCQSYDINHKSKSKFQTFAYTAMRNNIIKQNNEFKKIRKNEIPSTISEDPDQSTFYSESGVLVKNQRQTSPDSSIDIYDEIRKIKITKIQQKVLDMKISGLTFAEIGENLGISTQRVHQIHKTIREKLKSLRD